MKIAIVTDSTCDLPAELAEEWSIEVVPNVLVIGGESFADGVELSRREFYERLPGMKTFPTTASPSMAAFAGAYERLFSQGAGAVIAVLVSEQLSAVTSSASLAAQSFPGRVHFFDSRN